MDPDQLASQKQADLYLHCYQPDISGFIKVNSEYGTCTQHRSVLGIFSNNASVSKSKPYHRNIMIVVIVHLRFGPILR